MSTAKVTLFQDGIRTHVSINLPRKPRGIAPDRSATWTHLSHLQLGTAAPPCTSGGALKLQEKRLLAPWTLIEMMPKTHLQEPNSKILFIL